MEKQRWQLVEHLFLQIQDLPEGERARKLLELCGDDHDLHNEVVALQEYAGKDDRWLEDDQRAQVFSVLAAKENERLPTLKGPYEALEVLGRGGMGTVYVARQTEGVERTVAVKVMNSREPHFIARFAYEREVLAMLHHPLIAQVYDSGHTADGYPFLVMELVEGQDLLTYCDEAQLEVADRLAVFKTVCEAVSHAHRKGVIHCDLKPSNILVEEGAIPKIIDFGIAQRVAQGQDQLGPTRRLGTPAYMGPECFDGQSADTTGDVYALGVVLYQLLTGCLPLEDEVYLTMDREKLKQQILGCPMVLPSRRVLESGQHDKARMRGVTLRKLAALLREDLDYIVAKAMAPDPGDRYSSVEALQDDIKRLEARKTVRAHPMSPWYLVRKIVMKDTLLTSVVFSFICALFFGIASIYVGKVYAEKNKNQLEQAYEVLIKILAAADPRVNHREVGFRPFMHEARATVEGLSGDPLGAAKMYRVLGETLVGWGDFEAAKGEFEHAEAMYRVAKDEKLSLLHRLLDDDRPKKDEIDNLLKEVQLSRHFAEIQLGYNEDALQALKRLHTYFDKNGNQEFTLLALRGLADAYKAIPDTENAVRYYEAFIAQAKPALQDPSADTRGLQRRIFAGGLLNYGNFLIDTRADGWRDALVLFKRAQAIREDELGPLHPDSIAIKHAMGYANMAGNRFLAAKDDVIDVYEYRLKHLNADHPNTIKATHNYLRVAKRLKLLDRATLTAEFEKLIERKERVLGSEKLSTLLTMNNYADYIMKTDCEKGYQIMKEVTCRLGEEDPSLNGKQEQIRITYAEALKCMKHEEEALSLLTDIVVKMDESNMTYGLDTAEALILELISEMGSAH